jgi:hypothetical protein
MSNGMQWKLISEFNGQNYNLGDEITVKYFSGENDILEVAHTTFLRDNDGEYKLSKPCWGYVDFSEISHFMKLEKPTGGDNAVEKN